jgi:hypothetical protein
LVCGGGGTDAPSNMQWQSVAEGKAKDKWERKGCQINHESIAVTVQASTKHDIKAVFISTQAAIKRNMGSFLL